MMLWRERTLWIVVTATLGLALGAATLWGWPWENTASSMQASQSTDPYNFKAVPETAEELAGRLLFEQSQASADNGAVPDSLFWLGEADIFPERTRLYAQGLNAYRLAELGKETIYKDTYQLAMGRIVHAMRLGYPPAFEAYPHYAEKEMQRAYTATVNGNADQVWEIIAPLANEGYAPALMKMGDLLAQNFPLGYCIKPIFYAEAAKQGNEKALEFLANSYNDGFLTKKDKRAAYKLRHRLYQRNPDQFEQPIFEEYGLSDQEAETATAEDPFKGLPPFTFSILSPNASLDMLGRVSISGGMCNIDKDYSSPLRAAEQAPH